MTEEKPFLCSICFQPVNLNEYKIDEDGRAVHEACYAEMLLYGREAKKPEKKPPFLGTWRRVG
jgi:hypothetical protein